LQSCFATEDYGTAGEAVAKQLCNGAVALYARRTQDKRRIRARPAVLVFGGALPLLLLPVIAWLLPESVLNLVVRKAPRAKPWRNSSAMVLLRFTPGELRINAVSGLKSPPIVIAWLLPESVLNLVVRKAPRAIIASLLNKMGGDLLCNGAVALYARRTQDKRRIRAKITAHFIQQRGDDCGASPAAAAGDCLAVTGIGA
jgi:hypothetical protein